MNFDPVTEAVLKRRKQEEKQASLEAKFRSEWEETKYRRENLFTSFDENPPRATDFIVEGFLPAGRVALLAGDPKSGKTAFATALALAVAKGEPFAGMKTSQSAVLWMSCEESPAERGELIFHLRKTTEPGTLPLYTAYEHIAIDSEQGEGDLQSWVLQTQARLLVVDPLHGAHSGRSLHDGWAARKTLQLIKRFCAITNMTALVLHHLSKTGRKARVAESVQLAAIASNVMVLTSTPPPRFSGNEEGAGGWSNQTTGRLITLDCKGRGAHANRTYHFISENPLDYRQTDPPPEPTSTKSAPTFEIDGKVEYAVVNGAGNDSAAELAGRLQRNPNHVRNALARLLALGKVRVTMFRGNTRYYGPPLPKPEEKRKKLK